MEYIAPATDQGRACGSNCLVSQQNCKQSCGTQQQNCRLTQALQDQADRFQAQQEYQDYVRERAQQGKEVVRNVESFRNYSYGDQCDPSWCEGQCDQSFNICYST
ncbi:MAG: hypothetical protein K2Q01_02475, partial [Rickettsiales bacterium]|nr:hypothetical protein [Rickettsiales bacterium]